MATVCNACELTWPDHKINSDGICPECEEEEEVDTSDSQDDMHPWAIRRNTSTGESMDDLTWG